MKHYIYQMLLGFSLLLAATANAQTPVAQYAFQGNAKDGFGNDAAVHGAQLTADRFGWANNAFHFDGVQAYLQAANSAALNSNYASVSFWVNPTELPAQSEVYLLSSGGWQERWKISLPAHGKPIWTTNNSSGISDMDAGDANKLVPGVWKHLVFVHNGTKDIIYVNGVQAAEKNVSGTLNSTTKPLGIGYNAVDGGNFFNGALDEVIIFDGALSALQAAALYAAQSTAPVVPTGLVAGYSFSNNTLDHSAYGNHAHAKDVSASTDRFGYGASAFQFNGTSSEVTADNSLQQNSPYTTVSFWIKLNAYPGNSESFLLSNGGWQERWKISLPSHGKPVWTTNNASGISDMDSGGGNEVPLGKWAHLAMVHDGTKDRIYLNGVQVAEKAVSGTMNNTTHPLGIGYNPVDGGNWFDGQLDEVEIYNAALDATQIAALYTAESTFPGTATDLIAHYKLASEASDATQFNNNGTATPGVTAVADHLNYAGNAMHFDGAGSIKAANSPQHNSDYATISFWVKPDEFPASNEVFLLSNGGWQERWKISMPSHGKPVFTTNYENGISDMDAGTPLTVGQWKHVVMVHDGAKDKIFYNGVMVNQKDVVGKLKSTKYPLGIGYDPIDNGGFFKGSLDEVQLYNRALSDVEVAALYAAQNAPLSYNGDLIANYTFSGNAHDETPYSNHAQANGAQLSADRFGAANQAYAFNGTSDFVKAENSPQQISDFTTISFWINVKALPASSEAFILSNGGWQERWKISLPQHGKPVFTTNNSSGISDMDSGGGNELPVGVWKHVVMVHDGTTDKIFFDGVLKASKNVSGTLNATTKPLGIGYDPIDNGNYFNGSLDEVQIYKKALSDAEVAALYAAQSVPPAVTDTEAPSAPLNLNGAVAFTDITLSWLASTDNVGVTGYNVYQDGNKIATTANTSLQLIGVTPSTTFVFGVSAVDAVGNESTISTLNVTSGEDMTPDVTPPTIPANFQASVGAHSVLVSWDASTDDRAVKGYVVLLDGVFADSLANNEFSSLIGGLDAETPYTFEVYAFDAAGNESPHAELTVTTDQEINTGEPGMVAWYPFEGNANDATAYANHGAIGGNPVFQPAGHPNGGMQAIKFDGVQDSVLVPNAVQLISDYTTVSFWIRVDEQNPNIAESYVLDFGHWDQRWKISLPQHLKIVWTTNGKNTQFPNFISDMDSGDGNEMVKGFWWYVTMVHDGEKDLIYVNGELANSKPVTGVLNSTGRPMGIGSNPVEGGQYFNGAFDELKIYNKALSASEISKLFTTGTSGVNDLVNNDLVKFVHNVFPNPATDYLIIEHTLSANQPLLLRVFDAQGRQVDAVRFNQGALPQGQIKLQTGAYPQGKYFVDFIFGGKNLGSLKFTKG
jgi:chitodextrinase